MVFKHFPNHFIDPDAHLTITPSPTYSYGATSPHSSTLSYPSPARQSPIMASSYSPSSPLPSLNGPFPDLLPAPANLQIRLRSQDATLARLDAELEVKEEEEGIPPLMDEARMVGKGRVEALEDEDELSVREASCALEEFLRNRAPYAVLASQSLQALLGEKNALDFELPPVPLNMTPSFGRIASTPSGPSDNLSPTFSPRNSSASNSFERRKDNGISLPQRSPLSPISPLGIGQFDETTGKGLREWLLSRGKETGTQRKRECRSITFHDFTPDMRTGTHANVLVAHYTGGGLHERADVYEVDLPTTYTDPTTKLPTQGTQTWLWFLISRPVLTLSPTETNTKPAHISDAWSKIDARGRSLQVRPPPEFPMPIPTSWVVFACPASNVTEYPDCKDDSAPPSPVVTSTPYQHSLVPPYLSSPLRTRPRTSSYPAINRVYKRKDYDFSFQGTPIFEFSQAESFGVPSRPRSEILSVDSIGSWYPSDLSGNCSKAEWLARYQAWEEEVESLPRETRKEEAKAYRDRAAEEPHSRRGVWWQRFYEGVYKEEAKWRRIRECMSRGKCRVVVRWMEMEPSPDRQLPASSGNKNKKNKTSPNPSFGEDADGDSDMSDGPDFGLGFDLGLGLGVRLDGNSSSTRGDGKKIKERLVGRRVVSGPAARVTRSETRRKSGLGIFSTSQGTVIGSGVLIGIGGGVGGVGGGVEGSSCPSNAAAGDAGGGDGCSKEKRRKK